MGAPGNADPSRIRQTVQQGGDVDAIAVDLPFLFNDIPKVDPDPEGHPAFFRQLFVPAFQLLLDLHRALQGVHHARELSEKVTPTGIHDAALVFLDQQAHRLAVPLEGLESPGLILPHETAVLNSAGAQDSGELPFGFFRVQRDSPRMRKTHNRKESGKRFCCRRRGREPASRLPACRDGSAIVSRDY